MEKAAGRIVQLIRDPELRDRLGREAKEPVRQNLLLTRSIEQDLDLISAFQPEFRLSEAMQKYQ